MKKIHLIIFLLIIFFTSKAWSNPIISAISTNQINIDTNFNGAEILLFGAKTERGEVIIALRGPKQKYAVTKKQKLLGVWYNGKRVVFKDAYSYYSMFSVSDHLDLENNLLDNLELGPNNLKFEIKDQEDKQLQEEFQSELINRLKKTHLYSAGQKNIEFFDDNLFEAILKFPKNISYGVYTAEIYLIRDNKLVAFQAIPIFVNQVGDSARIRNFAYQNSFLYALMAVLIAIIAGFVANYIFSRFIHK
jgi:uncharacterized protein (TIGR02186 family)